MPDCAESSCVFDISIPPVSVGGSSSNSAMAAVAVVATDEVRWWPGLTALDGAETTPLLVGGVGSRSGLASSIVAVSASGS